MAYFWIKHDSITTRDGACRATGCENTVIRHRVGAIASISAVSGILAIMTISILLADHKFRRREKLGPCLGLAIWHFAVICYLCLMGMIIYFKKLWLGRVDYPDPKGLCLARSHKKLMTIFGCLSTFGLFASCFGAFTFLITLDGDH